MPKRDVISWNSMIARYVQLGLSDDALNLFHQMRQENVKPDEVTFISILKACAGLADLEQGMQIHLQVIRSGLELDAFVGSTLVDMYSKCRCINCARQVFDK
eukprot:c33287_g1_i1 orf=2-307(+)